MNLVIVESPAKCSKIQGFLGAGWRVIASMGHIRALKQELAAVGIDRDFEPTYEFMTKEKSKALKALKEAAADAATVYLAADDDREGEAIAYSVCLYLKLNPRTTPRAVFHEITERAVKAAVAAPRLIDMNRVNAQQARAMLDMMIGFTMSPLLWKHVARGVSATGGAGCAERGGFAKSLSAGRCQTPALRIVVEREDEIAAFKGSSSWRVGGEWSTAGDSRSAFKFDAALTDELDGEEDALNYLEMLHGDGSSTVTSNAVKPWTASPPPPLITSTLQQQASALYGCGPKNTMKIAQRLYEAGHITYMRTDKAVLCEEAVAAAKGWIEENYGAEYVAATGSATAAAAVPAKKKKGGAGAAAAAAAADGKSQEPKAQEAHEAIRPTHIEILADTLPGEWSATDKKIYGLIWQRTVQSVMAPATGETCTIRFQTATDKELDFTWQASWRRTIFLGWQRAGKVAELDDEAAGAAATAETDEPAAAAWEKATRITPGTVLSWQALKAAPHETKAPGRYTEATLVRELEKYGIGRPSTFASLIAAIQDKSYVETRNIEGKQVEIKSYSLAAGAKWPPVAATTKKTVGKEKQKLVPTELGRSALAFMLAHFEDLFDYKFTAQMEQKLDAVSEGREEWKSLLRTMWASYKERYEELNSGGGSVTGDSSKVRTFSGGLKAVMSKKGPLLLIESAAAGGAGARAKPATVFFGWPEGASFADLTEVDARKFIDASRPTFEWRGKPVILAKGKFGPYAKAGDTTASIKEGATQEEILAALDAKAAGPAAAAAPLKSYKEYEVRNGPYGPYITKPALKQKKFVSLSASALEKLDSFTEKDIADLYKAGLESKKKWGGGKK